LVKSPSRTLGRSSSRRKERKKKKRAVEAAKGPFALREKVILKLRGVETKFGKERKF